MNRQLPLSLPHTTAMGADDFLITPCNKDAAAWVGKWPDWPAHGLIVSGDAGSGKTHLLNLWVQQSNGGVVPAAKLVGHNVIVLASKANNIVAIDDVDMLVGNAEAEENLFHLYNYLKSAKGSLLLTMKSGAGQVGFMLPDLRSRLLTLPVAALAAPDDELVTALIVKQFRDRQVDLDGGVLAYLVPRMTRDGAGIRDIVARLDHAALAEGRKISIHLVRRILEDGNG